MIREQVIADSLGEFPAYCGLDFLDFIKAKFLFYIYFFCFKLDMNPYHDIVCSLLETPFSRRSEAQQLEVLSTGRPVSNISITSSDKKGSQEFCRSFQSSFFDLKKWLCGSFYLKQLYCWPCLLFAHNRVGVWVSGGYNDIKHLSEATKKHEGSKDHMKNFAALKNFEKSFTIKDAIIEATFVSLQAYNDEVRKNRKLLTYLIDTTVFLGKQELAFRGHDESSESLNLGNFRELFNVLIKNDVEILDHIKKNGNVFKGISKTIQNDLIGCISEYLLETINEQIKSAKFFGVQVDDTTDIVEKSQCAISVRYVTNKGEVKERFLGFFDVSEDRTANAMYALLSSILTPYDYKKKLVAQCYDGASVMAGSLNGLQMKVKQDAPNAFFTHCCAHRLNLVLQNGSKCIKKCRIYFQTLTSIPSFFNNSAKRTFVLTSVTGKKIPRSCETRWSSRSKTVSTVYSEWENLKTVFSKISDDVTSGAESANGARGYLNNFNSMDFAFLTNVYNEIFNITDILFTILQKKTLEITYCQKQIQIALNRIKNLRNDSEFEKLFNFAKERIANNEVFEIHKKRINFEINNNENTTFRALYFEILDNIINQVEIRFQDLSGLVFFSLADTSQFDIFNKNFPVPLVNKLVTQFPDIFSDKQKLKNELSVIYADKDFANLRLDEILKRFIDNDLCEIFPEAFTLFALIASIPATSVSVERNFSALKRILSFTRNSMSQSRLTSLSLISIEKQLLHELYNDKNSEHFINTIISKFSLIKDRRINLTYKQ